MQIAFLILAAGKSSRFGSPKQLAIYKNKPLLVHAIELALTVGIKPFVVLGANKTLLESDDQVSAALDQAVRIHSENWADGLSASLQDGLRGIEAAEEIQDGILISLADQPLVQASDLAQIMTKIRSGERQIICSNYQNSLGVPAYFSYHYLEALYELRGDQGAKKVILNNPHEIVSLERKLTDIDTPDDLQQLID